MSDHPEVQAARASGRYTVIVALVSGVFGIAIALIGSSVLRGNDRLDLHSLNCPISAEGLATIISSYEKFIRDNAAVVSENEAQPDDDPEELRKKNERITNKLIETADEAREALRSQSEFMDFLEAIRRPNPAFQFSEDFEFEKWTIYRLDDE